MSVTTVDSGAIHSQGYAPARFRMQSYRRNGPLPTPPAADL